MSKQLFQVTEKGQVTIPAELRDELGIKKGTLVLFHKQGHNQITMQIVTGEQINLLTSFPNRTIQAPVDQSNTEQPQTEIKRAVKVHVQGARIICK